MAANYHILLIEDEYQIAALLRDYFLHSGMRFTHVADGKDAMAVFTRDAFDLVVLDIALPHISGIEICREIRRMSTVPVIILSALSAETERLLGQQLEADDYLGKPFSPREVVAKAQALLRSSNRKWLSTKADATPVCLTLDATRYEVCLQHHTVTLTRIEFSLFHLLTTHPGRIYSRGQLMTTMYGDQRIVSERTIDSHIKKLRNKLKLLNTDEMIESSYGVGYRYVGMKVSVYTG